MFITLLNVICQGGMGDHQGGMGGHQGGMGGHQGGMRKYCSPKHLATVRRDYILKSLQSVAL